MYYLALLRGINVGGKNKVSMSQLRQTLSDLGLQDVTTYINSGNVLLRTAESAHKTAERIEDALSKNFTLDSDRIKVLVVSLDTLRAVVMNAPKGFGQTPEHYHSDVAFFIGMTAKEAMPSFKVNPDVDTLWEGEGVIYYQRLSAKRTKSKLSYVIGTPTYKNMTIRSWNTTTKLLALIEKAAAQ